MRESLEKKILAKAFSMGGVALREDVLDLMALAYFDVMVDFYAHRCA